MWTNLLALHTGASKQLEETIVSLLRSAASVSHSPKQQRDVVDYLQKHPEVVVLSGLSAQSVRRCIYRSWFAVSHSFVHW
jgi:hypothetical protein